VAVCAHSPARADEAFNHKVWNFASGTGNLLYLAAGVGLPLIEDGRRGRDHTLRAADSLLTSELFSEGLKRVIKEVRPDRVGHDSLPSGHATAAFSVAAIESALHPSQSIYWYGGATLIAASRVGLHRHTVGDVLAGAVLGYGVGRLEMSSRRGLLLAPFIQPEKHAVGLSLSGRF
jgi:membrane-associated phospholipid phosphatase